MPKGVPSSFQENDPWPVYIERGERRAGVGRGRQRVHRLPQRLRRDVRRPREPADRATRSSARWTQGTHFAAPTEGSIAVAEELRRRFGLPQWRFTNSGTESTMDAVHVARGATGRDMILKIEGSYHGHHDAVMVSVYPPLEALGDRDDPRQRPLRRRLSARDHRAHALGPLQRRAGAGAGARPARGQGRRADHGAGDDEHQHRPAASRATSRRCAASTAEHGVMLIFDEVKTGATISPGGATQRFGVQPDIDHAREGHLRRPAGRRDRDDGGAGRGDRRRHRAPVRHVQRQPARDGGRRRRP